MASSKKKKKVAKKMAPASKKAKVKAKPKAKSSLKSKAKSKPKASTKPKATAKAKASVKAKASKKTQPVAKSKSVAKTKDKTASTWTKSFQPLDDRIVVKVLGAAEKTPGGLYIPGNVESKPNRGKVLVVGRGRKNKKGQIRPMDVQAGDEVLFAEYAGTPITFDGQEALILREEDVLGISQS